MQLVPPRLWIGAFCLLMTCSVMGQQSSTGPDGLYRILRKGDQPNLPLTKLRSESEAELSNSNSCNCTSNVEGQLLLCDNFQTYDEGPITPQSNLWSLWPGATRDADVDASGSNKYLRLRHENGTESDVLLDLGNQTEGRYHLSFRLWTWEGFSGYYNVQHNSNFSSSQEANWAYHVQFIDGQGNLRIGSFNRPLATRTFSYNQNAWNFITQIIDLDEDEIELQINGTTVARWQFSLGSRSVEKRLGALDFYAREEFNGQFVVDNICLVRTDAEVEPPAEVNLTCADRGDIEIVDVQLSLKNVQVRNTGPGTTVPTRLGYYLSTNTNFTTQDYLIASAEIPALGPGEVATFSLDMDLRDAEVPDDFYYLGYVIDYPGLVDETNEDDNNDCYWRNIRFQYITLDRDPNLTCQDRGDLRIQDQILEINNLEIANTGNQDAPGSVLGVYLSSNTNITNSDLLIGTINVPPVPEGGEVSVSFSTRLDTLSQVPSGDYYLGFFIDHLNTVEESDDNDNICLWTESTITINSEPPFINLSCIGLGNLTVDGQQITISNYQISNIGNTASGSFSVAFYLSDNESISSADFLVKENPINGIGAESSIQASTNIDLSQLNLPPGDYYLGLVVDPQSEVEESDKSDNSSCVWLNQQITIFAPTNPECTCSDPEVDNICEDFEAYSPGFFSNQSDCFGSGSVMSGEEDDGVITQVNAISGVQSLGIRENGQADARFYLGNKDAGTYDLEWMMFIPSGKSARYAIEGEPFFGEKTKLEMTFGNASSGRGFIVSDNTTFNYPEGEWFSVRHRINMDQNFVSVYINDQMILETWPFYFGVEHVEFLSANANSTYFIDDLSFDFLFIIEDGTIRTAAWEEELFRRAQNRGLSIFPNPGTDQVFIKKAVQANAPTKVQLLNELGQVVWQQEYNQLDFLDLQLDVGRYQRGLYFLSIQNAGERQVEKLVLH